MKVKELLSEPHRWCKGAYARNKEGKPVNYLDPAACSWCLRAAVLMCYPGDNKLIFSSLNHIIHKTHSSVVIFNDDYITTHKELMKVIGEANI